MDENQRQVLEMLAAEKITVEQADQLLEALKAQPQSGYASDRPMMEPQGSRSQAGERQSGSKRDLVVALAAVIDAAGIRELHESGLMDELPRDLLMSLVPVAGISYIRDLRDSGLIDRIPRDLLLSLVPIASVTRIRELYDAELLADIPRDTLLSLVPVADVAYIRELRDSGLLDGPADHRPDVAGVAGDSPGASEPREARV